MPVERDQRTGRTTTTADSGTYHVGPTKSAEEHKAGLAAAKYNPVLRSKELSQAQVQASGGLGAVAAAARKKKQQADALEGKQ